MEKITLKPIAKELLYKADEVNTHFDVVSYSGSNTQEKTLGSLYLIGHVKYGDEDLAYVLSLASSLARREFYSESALKAQDPRKAFEATLKKLNEVLEDFFQNKNLTLNIGLAAISGEQIYISKLGKFKVGLARSGEYIDVLNNVSLFHKSDEKEEKFSNIISGKLQSGDKIFAFFPSRPITSREKSLQNVLVRDSQDVFEKKIDGLSEASANFACCGVHISIEQIKEIPLQSVVSTPVTATLASNPSEDEKESEVEKETEPAIVTRTYQPKSNSNPAPIRPRIVASELSVGRKDSSFGRFTAAAARFKNINRLSTHMKFRGFVIVAIIILVPLITFAAIYVGGDSSEVKEAYTKANENLKLAQSRFAQNDPQEARKLLALGLEGIANLEGDKIENIKKDIEESLNKVDRVSEIVPEKINSLTEEDIKAIGDNNILLSSNATPIVWHNKAELLTVKNPKDNTARTYTLKDPVTASDSTIYAGNLYTISGNTIYRYGDALNGGTSRSVWGSNESEDSILSIAIDGDLFALMSSGKINVYFKGEKEREILTSIIISENSKIFTSQEIPNIYLLNPSSEKIYVINKENGELVRSHKTSSVGIIKDIAVNDDGYVWILGEDNSVWKLKY